MEKSIENIWKKGSGEFSEIKAPVVIDIYNRKSIHIMDQIKNRLKLNVKMLAIFAVIMPVYCLFIGVPVWLIISLFLLFALPAFYTQYESKEIQNLDPADDSYSFLTSLRNQIQSNYRKNQKFARLFYPIALILSASMIWFADGREELTNFIMDKTSFENTELLVAGVFWGVVLVASILMGVFAKRIYKFDVNLMYGSLFQKLNEIISDMKEMKMGGG
jgi:hypothetical protein